MAYRCGAFNPGRWLRKATGRTTSRRHFSHIDQIIQFQSTNATVSKSQYRRIYPLTFHEDVVIIPLHCLQSPRRIVFFVKKQHLPMFNVQLVEYIHWYCRYDLTIPTADGWSIGGMHTRQFKLLDGLVVNFQCFCCCDSTAHTIRCTGDLSFGNAQPWNEYLQFRIEDVLKGNVGELRPAHSVRIV